MAVEVIKHVFVFAFNHRRSWCMIHGYDHAIGLGAVECVVLVLDLLCQLSF